MSLRLAAALLAGWALIGGALAQPSAPGNGQAAGAVAPVLLEILAPRPEAGAAAGSPPTTTREFFNLLGRTTPGAQVVVAGEAVPVFSTGIFVRDRIPLVPGLNAVRISASGAGGQVLERTLIVERTVPPPVVQWPQDRLFLNGASLRPASAVQVLPGEFFEVAVQATPGQRVEARLPGSDDWQPLVERADRAGFYRAQLAFASSAEVAAAPLQVRVSSSSLPRAARPRSITALTPGAVGQWRHDPDRLVVTGPEGAELLHGLHEVRLGGPFLAELPPGVLLALEGRRGNMLKLRLAPDTTAWVDEASVAPAPAGTPAPHGSFTTVSLQAGDEGDVVQVPLAAPVPYAVRVVSDLASPSGRQALELEFFASHLATTWLVQRANARVVRELSIEQAGPGRVRLRIVPLASRLWGWRVERTLAALRLVLRPPPALAAQGSPLAGLKVALEPGHGSTANLGAVGATAVPEKDINRWAVQALKDELEGAGAEVVVVREGDENPPLRERARRVEASGAQLFVSVHANASDTTLGYLRSSGVSTYYKHDSSRELAAALQRRLLEHTGLPDFGLVGNFNYTPIRRVTWMPAALVEQAFVTHPGDEAKLLDPAWRATMARAVRQGLEDFLRQTQRLP